MSKLAQPGEFCPNPGCADYGKPQSTLPRNIIKFGRAHNGQQRYQFRTCRHTFTATKGTLFYRRQTPASEIIKALAAGLTDHLWTVKELLTTVVLPNT